jgi:hypothetical protein
MADGVGEQSHRACRASSINTHIKEEVAIVKNTLRHLAASALACAGLLVGLATDAHAKAAWESHAGGEAYDASKGGIIQTPDGGFVTVGEASSFSRGGDYDVYVVKNDLCGEFQWAFTYDIGGNDHGRKIRQTPDGGFIITGETENTRNCCTRNDAFLMKLKESGEVEWVKTYGGKGDDKGADVQLYYGGEKGYLIAGRTNSFGAGRYDGWLIATDLNGSMVWSRVYGGASIDGFNGLTQTRSGDIVATGESFSYQPIDPILRRSSDLWLVRTNDQGNVIWSHHYGGRANELGYEVIEAPKGFGDRDDDLIACGYSTSISPKCQAYLLRVDANGAWIIDHLYGGGNGSDEFRDLVTTPWTDDIYAVGRILKPEGGFGGFDVFTVQVNAKLNLNWAYIHGGDLDDEGWGIAADEKQGGFGWSGSTFTFTFGKEDMYMGLSFPWGEDFCHDAIPGLGDNVPEFVEQKAPTGEPLVSVECSNKVEAVPNDMYKIICSTCFGGGGGDGINAPGGNGDLSHVPYRGVERATVTAEMAKAGR